MKRRKRVKGTNEESKDENLKQIEMEDQKGSDSNRALNVDRKKARRTTKTGKGGNRPKVKSHGNKRISTLEYFIEAGLNKLTRGSLDIQGTQFEISYSKILSERNAKRVIYIREYPQLVYAGGLELFRTEMYKQLVKEDRRDIGLTIIEHSLPNKIMFANNRKISGSETAFRRQRSQQIIDKNIKETNIRTAMVMNASKDDVELINRRIARLDRKIDSFDVIRKHQASGGETLKTFTFMEVTGRTTEQVDRATDIVLGILASNHYKYSEIFDLESYLKTFGAASLNYSMKPELDVHPQTLTSQISSLSPTYSEGIIRSEQGDICIGHSIETNYPVHVSLSESTDASNILIVADTGSGKTVLAKGIALGALNHRGNTYNVILNDYKGEEHDKLADIVKGSHIVSMGLKNPKFINSLIIPDASRYGFPDDKSAYYLSANSTAQMLSILVGVKDLDDQPRVENVCADIVDRVYSQHQIDVRRPSTYIRSKDLDFKEELWKSIKYITSESNDMEVRHTREILSLVKTSLEYYFSQFGSKSYMFSNPINIDTLMDSKLVVFDYGTQTVGGTGSMLEKETQARMFQKEFFSTLFAAYKKLKKEYTLEIDEEVSRQLTQPILMKALNDKVTGGRSSNRINLLIINSIKGFLDGDNPNAAAIRDNINTVMIGRCKKAVAMEVLDYFGLNQAERRIQPVLRGLGRYENSFLVAINTGKMFDMFITSYIIPPRILRETEIFKSKDVETNKSTRVE